MTRRVLFRRPRPYGDEGHRASHPAAAAGWAALIMFAGLLVFSFVMAGVATLSPETVASGGFVPVGVVVSAVVQFLLAVLAGGAAWRRLAGGPHGGSGAGAFLWTLAGPVAVILVIDVLAIAAASTPWWRLLLDVAVTALGAVLGGVRVRRGR
jgi:hypothetical protein